jgi:CMP-N,N'-diacetyllegionaminic acid synthase
MVGVEQSGARGAAVILARAGSKGVPGKNWASVGGVPCVAWTIDAALAARRAGVLSTVAVSTDDPRVAEIAHHMGAVVVQRPAGLAGDTARVDDALWHAVTDLESRGMIAKGPRVPIVMLYANVPVRPVGLIEEAVGLLRSSGCDSVQSFQPVGKHHPWWTCVVGEGGNVGAWDGGAMFHGCFRRQDLPPAHAPDGAVTVVTRASLLGEVGGVEPGPHAFLGRDRRAVVNPEGSVVDIDTMLDLRVADAILREASMERRTA